MKEFITLIEQEKNLLLKYGVITPQKLYNYKQGHFPDGKTVLLILALLPKKKLNNFINSILIQG